MEKSSMDVGYLSHPLVLEATVLDHSANLSKETVLNLDIMESILKEKEQERSERGKVVAA